MKNYKNILLVVASILTISNSHITQTFNLVKPLSSLVKQLFFNLFPKNRYEKNFNQLRSDLKGIPESEINAMVVTGRKELNQKKPTNDNEINNIIREIIINRVKMNTSTIAYRLTNNKVVVDNTVQSVEARFNRGKNLNGLALAEFFDHDSLKQLVLQNIKDPSRAIYTTEHSTQPAKENFASKRSSRLHPRYNLYNNFLNQLKHNLKGIPESDINAIVAIGRKKLIQKKPTNDNEINNIIREAIINRVKMNTSTITYRLTNNKVIVDNTVQSIEARLNRGKNLNGLALAKFFGISLEYMIQQNISSTQKEQVSKFAPSAPKEPEQEEEN